MPTQTQENHKKVMNLNRCGYKNPSTGDCPCRNGASYNCTHCPSSFCLTHGIEHQRQLKEEIKHLLCEAQVCHRLIIAIGYIRVGSSSSRFFQQIVRSIRLENKLITTCHIFRYRKTTIDETFHVKSTTKKMLFPF